MGPGNTVTSQGSNAACLTPELTKAQELRHAVSEMTNVLESLENLKDDLGITCDPVCDRDDTKEPECTLSRELEYAPANIRDHCARMHNKIDQIREALI